MPAPCSDPRHTRSRRARGEPSYRSQAGNLRNGSCRESNSGESPAQPTDCLRARGGDQAIDQVAAVVAGIGDIRPFPPTWTVIYGAHSTAPRVSPRAIGLILGSIARISPDERIGLSGIATGNGRAREVAIRVVAWAAARDPPGSARAGSLGGRRRTGLGGRHSRRGRTRVIRHRSGNCVGRSDHHSCRHRQAGR